MQIMQRRLETAMTHPVLKGFQIDILGGLKGAEGMPALFHF